MSTLNITVHATSPVGVAAMAYENGKKTNVQATNWNGVPQWNVKAQVVCDGKVGTVPLNVKFFAPEPPEFDTFEVIEDVTLGLWENKLTARVDPA